MAERVGAGAGKPVVEELSFRSEQVYVALVVNRRHRSARIVDFLAGNFPQKQAAIHQIAVREGIERVYTLVEREESAGWAKVGYAREGNIPGYYKRSDAYVMGHLIHNPPRVNADGALIAPVADMAKAEKALNAAKKLNGVGAPKSARTQIMSDVEMQSLRAALKGKQKGFTSFDDRFGRTGARVHVTARDGRGSAKAGEQIVSAEVQECFGNAYLQIAQAPATEVDAKMLVAALNGLIEHLKAREVASTFAFAHVNDTLTSAAMLAAGFRKTGLLAQHLVGADNKRADTILWTRKTGAAAADADAA
jgi:hypothetical protein